MSKPGIEAFFQTARVVPVIRIEDPDRAVDLAETLVGAGLKVIEITLRTEAAIPAIERIARHVPEALIGAGTIVNGSDLARAADAGAQFAIAPGCCEPLYRTAERQTSIPLIPGVATASEIMLGLEYGYRCFKFFPAGAAGGVAMLKSWHGPFTGIRFIPTGGIDPASAPAYLQLPNVLAVGGSWMVPPEALRDGDWDRIRQLVSACVALKPSGSC